MKKTIRPFRSTVRFLTLVAVGAAIVSLPTHATVIYFDDFNGDSSLDLNGQAPDTTSGANWAAESWKRNGSIAGAQGGSNALLPFAPTAGNIYRLDVTLNDPLGNNTKFLGVGFTASANTSTAFRSGGASPWYAYRGNAEIESVSGSGFSNRAVEGTFSSTHTLSIILDASDSMSSNWTAEWLIDNVSVRGPQLAVQSDSLGAISHVGFGVDFNTVPVNVDRVQSFQLSIVPEPSALSLLCAIGVIMFALHRRRP